MKQGMEMGQLKMDFAEEITTEQIGGIDFDLLLVDLNLGKVTVKQKYYSTVMKGYALAYILSFTTPEEEKETMAIIQSTTFSKN